MAVGKVAASQKYLDVWRAVGSQVVAEVGLLTCESSELHRFCLVMVTHNEILDFDTIIVRRFWQVYYDHNFFHYCYSRRSKHARQITGPQDHSA